MDIRRVRVTASHTIVEVGGVAIGVGQYVDLDQEIAPSLTYREVFDPSYFEPAAKTPPGPEPEQAPEPEE